MTNIIADMMTTLQLLSAFIPTFPDWRGARSWLRHLPTGAGLCAGFGTGWAGTRMAHIGTGMSPTGQ